VYSAADNDVELQQGAKFEKSKVFTSTHHESVQPLCKVFRGNIYVNKKINFILSHTHVSVSLELLGGGHMSLMNLNTSAVIKNNDIYMTFLFRSNKEKSEKEKNKDKDYEAKEKMIKKEERREEGEREKRSKEKKEEKAAQREERALQREERSYRVSNCFCVFCTVLCNIII
jgi:26S proteasome regulatory complex component